VRVSKESLRGRLLRQSETHPDLLGSGESSSTRTRRGNWKDNGTELRSLPDVCYVTFPNSPTKFSGKGLDRYAYELIRGASLQCGLETSVVTSRTRRANYILREAETVFRLRQIRARIFHATSEYGLGCLLLAKKRPIVVTIHDLLPQLFFRHAPLVYANQIFRLNLARYADRVISTSTFYSDLFVRTLNIPKDRIEVVHYGVDHLTFRPRRERTKGRISRVLYIGGLNPLKGASDLIRAFADFCKSESAELLIGGRGKHSEVLMELSRKAGMAEKVSFLGYVEEDQLPDLYNSADVLVWPSYMGFGLSTLEAMSCGTPVIAANCLDSPEYLGNSAILYSPGDVVQLRDALSSVLSADSSWKRRSDDALKWSEHFSWSKMAKDVLRLYDGLYDPTGNDFRNVS